MADSVRLLTVDELIDLLEALPPEQRALPVDVEGCDCNGPAIGLDVGSQAVLITRGEEIWDDDSNALVWRPIS